MVIRVLNAGGSVAKSRRIRRNNLGLTKLRHCEKCGGAVFANISGFNSGEPDIGEGTS